MISRAVVGSQIYFSKYSSRQKIFLYSPTSSIADFQRDHGKLITSKLGLRGSLKLSGPWVFMSGRFYWFTKDLTMLYIS